MRDLQTDSNSWPELRWSEWQQTADTLHMWTQIVGKTRLALSPVQAHWWNVALYVSARGLSTSAMPYRGELIEIEFDFVSHELHFRLSSGTRLSILLRAQSVADFFAEYQRSLAALGVSVRIDPMPVELKNPISFGSDREHASYNPEYVNRFWQVLVHADRVLQKFSSSFIGKISPVHFFWGSFDLAVTRFSGRPAPVREGADSITREAYSHEVISAGFWPGNGGFGEAAFYCYAAPASPGLDAEPIEPAVAKYDGSLGEFIFKYDDLLAQASPDEALLKFLQSSYEAAARLAKWDRASLERSPQS